MNNLDDIINHIRNRSYMGGIERDKARIKSTGEVFTPLLLVQEILDTLDQSLFSDPTKTFIDPSGCGDGMFLGEVLIRKLENGIDFETSLKSIYGVEKELDNLNLCKERLLCKREDLRWIVDKNFYHADALLVKNWKFDGSDPYKSDADIHFDSLFFSEK